MILDRIADQDQGTDTDERRHEHKKDLKADPEAQGEPADVHLARLTSKIMQSRRVIFFKVLVLGLEELRLLSQEFDCIARDFGIVACEFGRHSRRECVRASQRFWSFDVTLLVLVPEHSLRHTVSVLLFT
jgi:hypothetical protein